MKEKSFTEKRIEQAARQHDVVKRARAATLGTQDSADRLKVPGHRDFGRDTC